jgi:hypothetical protein
MAQVDGVVMRMNVDSVWCNQGSRRATLHKLCNCWSSSLHCCGWVQDMHTACADLHWNALPGAAVVVAGSVLMLLLRYAVGVPYTPAGTAVACIISTPLWVRPAYVPVAKPDRVVAVSTAADAGVC